jgi:hypothetical protein
MTNHMTGTREEWLELRKVEPLHDGRVSLIHGLG